MILSVKRSEKMRVSEDFAGGVCMILRDGLEV